MQVLFDKSTFLLESIIGSWISLNAVYWN